MRPNKRYFRLSQLLIQLHELKTPEMMAAADRKSAAFELARLRFGTEGVLEFPNMINVAALALSQERLCAHRLTPSAIRQVRETEIHALPAEPPNLMKSGWLIESASLEEPLFEDVVALGGYTLGEDSFVIGWFYPEFGFVAKWTPEWGDSDIEGQLADDPGIFIKDAAAHTQKSREGIKFALTLALLLEAEGTPVEVAEQRVVAPPRQKKPGEKKAPPLLGWSIRHVRLGASGHTSQAAAEDAERTPGEPQNRDGLKAETVPIKGHLRRQAHGVGRKERKLIFVAGFEAIRYTGSKPVRIYVESD